MELTEAERAMLRGEEGEAKQAAMDLLVRYGEALDAERLVETDNVTGTPGMINEFLANYYEVEGNVHETVFARFNLDADEAVEIPAFEARTARLQGTVEPEHWEEFGTDAVDARLDREGEAFEVEHGVEELRTCTPYHAGMLPAEGEHCAWMESSAVVFANSVIGARVNVEGRESTSAAMLTGRIPDWGLHREENRYGTHRVDVEVRVDDIMEWGMLGYFVGANVVDALPVLVGDYGSPSHVEHKHFGAAAATSGGIEMYHVVGETPEAPTPGAAFGPNDPVETFTYDAEARRRVYEELNSVGDDRDVDFVMLGCPHYDLEQVREVSRLLEGERIDDDVDLWIFSSRKVRDAADEEGLSAVIEDAGGAMMMDTCSAMSQAVPQGTNVVAMDSAKQSHYLPAILGVEAWFGSTADVIDAAITGTWGGELS